MRRRHDMPFGATVLDAQSTRFRLWAPAAGRVDLVLRGASERSGARMRREDNGWFDLIVAGAPCGTRYAFRIDDGLTVPDPASRCNPDDVHAPSMVVDALAFEWRDGGWRGRPWEEAVIYELHVGAFSPEGTFEGVASRLDYLRELGVTAIELMPVADFPGRRNWGYDGALQFAPDATYGTPEDLKRLVEAAHLEGLMVFLDVVYNHFGPEGNYLHVYAPHFFSPRYETPWGAAIDFDGEHARTVRDFFVHNALYWLEEFHFDGLRLDAVHAIADDSRPDIVSEIAAAVRTGPGAERHVHLVLENDRNQAAYLARDAARRPLCATAQWNDDVHHALHVLATGERDGYYADYAARPIWHLGRGLAEGFAYQGERSPYRHGAPRGAPCTHLPATAFVSFLQTHDQVGNRAFGERIGVLAEPAPLAAILASVLLAPSIPLLFMGEEFSASTRFQFFCDFGPELARSVTAGRLGEFARLERFRDASSRAAIPDPVDPATFERSKLAWGELEQAAHRDWLIRYRELLRLRREHIVPRLRSVVAPGRFSVTDPSVLAVEWVLGDRTRLRLLANLGDAPVERVGAPCGQVLYASPQPKSSSLSGNALAPWSVIWPLGADVGSMP